MASGNMTVAPWVFWDWYFGMTGHRKPRAKCPRCGVRLSDTFYAHRCADYDKWPRSGAGNNVYTPLQPMGDLY